MPIIPLLNEKGKKEKKSQPYADMAKAVEAHCILETRLTGGGLVQSKLVSFQSSMIQIGY